MASTTASEMTVSLTMSPTSTASPSPTPNANNTGPTSSPLLFFVALGFGVVFTNLWIIVGVKYCFRYNQRNRQRALGEDGNPIDLGLVPRPQRRRREKKLMTMDEVNDRFPLTKYKAWRAQRADEGLPTEGGVTAPPSRAASIKDVDDVADVEKRPGEDDQPAGPVNTLELAQADHAAKTDVVVPAKIADSDDPSRDAAAPISTTPAIAPGQVAPTDPSGTAATTKQDQTLATPAVAPRRSIDDESDPEDDPIRAPAPAEMLAVPGDTCAICIDNLEDDDDVRGLSCGHAFHAACVDPWLTSRRACCPLCKADYYVPKARNPNDLEQTSTNDQPQEPGSAYLGRAGGMLPLPRFTSNRFFTPDQTREQSRALAAAQAARLERRRTLNEERQRRHPGGRWQWQWQWRGPRVSNPFRRNRTEQQQQQQQDQQMQAPQTTTPAALEAGTAAAQPGR